MVVVVVVWWQLMRQPTAALLHCPSAAQGVSVVLDDGSGGETRCPARVLATDAAHDLAVLQVSKHILAQAVRMCQDIL